MAKANWYSDTIYSLQQLTSQPATRRTATFASASFGFTIVELLIVIVVIGILAAIVVVAYNGISTRANNTAKLTEINAFAKLFEVYKAQNGQYPQQQLATSTQPTTNPYGNTIAVGYCIGTGYPNAGNPSLPSCYSMSTGTNLSYVYRENDTDAAAIRNDLATVGKVPGPVKDFRVNNVMGPVAFYYTDRIRLVTVIKGETINDCPSNMTRHYPSDQATLVAQNYRLECRIELMK